MNATLAPVPLPQDVPLRAAPPAAARPPIPPDPSPRRVERAASTGQDDAALLERLAAGDLGALDVLYARYARAVVAVAARIVGDFPAAEEVLQDTFLRVWRQAGTYRAHRGSVTAWLLSIARNLAIDEVRRRQSRPRGIPGADADLLLAGLADERENPERDAWLTTLRPVLVTALGQLSPVQREAVELAYLRGLSHREVAEAVGAPIGTIKTRLQLGVRKLRAQMLDAGFDAAETLPLSRCAGEGGWGVRADSDNRPCKEGAMPHYPYLIVGGGTAADYATRGIRQLDSEGAIGLIGAEPVAPYNRPPLSKRLWQGKPFDSIWLKTDRRHVDLHLGRTVRALDLANKRVSDDQGTDYTFDKLLLATGGTPRRLPFGDDRVIYFRTARDYERLREQAGPGRRFVVVGGGFIGSEIAAALAMAGSDVTLVFPEAGIGARTFPADLAAFLNGYYREQGVEVLPGQTIVGMTPRGEQEVVRVRDEATGAEREIVADGVVAGIGISPNVELAREAGLEVGNGIIVDELLRTSHPDVYAAGDVAEFFQPQMGIRRRVEHEDNAKLMGRQAGRIMAGEEAPYHHLPLFYSDLFDLGYEAVGDLDARLETVADWKEPYREGVVYYLDGGRVRGVLLWNDWGQVEAARELLAAPGPIERGTLIGRIPTGV